MKARRAALLLIGLLLSLPVGAQTLAVLPFQNNTGDSALDPLGRGLADMFVTDLSVVQTLTLVERSRMAEVLAELDLQQSGVIDPATAASAGKGLGATHVLVGAIVAMSPSVRIDARMVDVETGVVTLSVSSTGPKEDFFFLEKELADQVVAKLGITVSARERAKLGRLQTESFPAFFAWSQGLDASARGDAEAARRAIKEALSHDDDFAAAAALLAQIQERAASAGAASDVVFDAQAAEIMKVIAQTKRTGDHTDLLALTLPYLRATSSLSARQRMAVSSAVLDLDLSDEVLVSFGPADPGRAINEVFLFDRLNASVIAGLNDELLAWGPLYIERYPGSSSTVSVRGYVQQALATSAKREAGLQQREALEAEAKERALQLRCEGAYPLVPALEACEAWIKFVGQQGLDPSGFEVAEARKLAIASADVAWMARMADALATTDEGAEDAVMLRERIPRLEERQAKLPPTEGREVMERRMNAVHRLKALASAGAWDRWDKLAGASLERWITDPENARPIVLEVFEGHEQRRDVAAGQQLHDLAVAHSVDLSPVHVLWIRDQREAAEAAKWAQALALKLTAEKYRRVGLDEEAVALMLQVKADYPEYPGMPAEKALGAAAQIAYSAQYPWHNEVARALYVELDRIATDPTYKQISAAILALPAN